MKAGNVFENPLFHFKAYTLRNPVVVEALEAGAYDEWCPGCGGRGRVTIRPAFCVRDTPEDKPMPAGTHRGSEDCRKCRVRCPWCRGAKLRPDVRTVCRQDFLDADDIAVAEALIPGVTLEPDFNERQLR